MAVSRAVPRASLSALYGYFHVYVLGVIVFLAYLDENA